MLSFIIDMYLWISRMLGMELFLKYNPINGYYWQRNGISRYDINFIGDMENKLHYIHILYKLMLRFGTVILISGVLLIYTFTVESKVNIIRFIRVILSILFSCNHVILYETCKTKKRLAYLRNHQNEVINELENQGVAVAGGNLIRLVGDVEPSTPKHEKLVKVFKVTTDGYVVLIHRIFNDNRNKKRICPLLKEDDAQDLKSYIDKKIKKKNVIQASKYFYHADPYIDWLDSKKGIDEYNYRDLKIYTN